MGNFFLTLRTHTIINNGDVKGDVVFDQKKKKS